MKIKQIYWTKFLKRATVALVIISFLQLAVTLAIQKKLQLAKEQEVSTAMSEHAPISYKNEKFTIIQYDYTTRKVLLRGQKGDILVYVSQLD
jgi:hypothetical protein